MTQRTRRSSEAKPATIYDVARVAGLSHQSVSRVLRDVPGVLPQTRERVEAALKELDYRPSAVARELASYRRNRIGVVGYESFESSTAKVLRGVDEVATREGFVLEMVNVDPLGDVGDIAKKLDAINGMDVVGLLATSPTEQIRLALDRSVFRMPVFVDDHGDEGADTGDSLSARLVLDHLVSLGHRRIVHVAGPPQWDSAVRRLAVYERTMRSMGLAPYPAAFGDWSAKSGYEATAELPWGQEPTAIFVANDRMALGVLRALKDRGMDVPRDVSVVGIDDIPEAEYFCPPLTTAHVDFAAAGRIAAERLVALIRNEPSDQPYPERRLVVRGSAEAPTR